MARSHGQIKQLRETTARYYAAELAALGRTSAEMRQAIRARFSDLDQLAITRAIREGTSAYLAAGDTASALPGEILAPTVQTGTAGARYQIEVGFRVPGEVDPRTGGPVYSGRYIVLDTEGLLSMAELRQRLRDVLVGMIDPYDRFDVGELDRRTFTIQRILTIERTF